MPEYDLSVPTPQSSSLQIVRFLDADLYLIDLDGEPYTAVRPIAQGMGLSWDVQRRKLATRRQRWRLAEVSLPIPIAFRRTSSDPCRELCIALRKLPAWLDSMSCGSRASPEARLRVARFQDECDDQLWQAWHAASRAGTGTPSPAEATQILQSLLARNRYTVAFDKGGLHLTPIPSSAHLVDLRDLPRLLREPGIVPISQLSEVVRACVSRLTGGASEGVFPGCQG